MEVAGNCNLFMFSRAGVPRGHGWLIGYSVSFLYFPLLFSFISVGMCEEKESKRLK